MPRSVAVSSGQYILRSRFSGLRRTCQLALGHYSVDYSAVPSRLLSSAQQGEGSKRNGPVSRLGPAASNFAWHPVELVRVFRAFPHPFQQASPGKVFQSLRGRFPTDIGLPREVGGRDFPLSGGNCHRCSFALAEERSVVGRGSPEGRFL